MATTPNFNWSTPDNTGLVKNGALDIRTLGNSIDSSMADLKGGTTGQVLAKASNTDMDFSWVAQDDSNAIQNAIVDAKGDIIAATANDTPARLAVGTNNQVLTADSSTATGLKWATPATSSSGLTLIARTSFTSVAGQAFDNVFTSTYKQYMVVIENISAATAADDLLLQLRYAGPTTQASGYYGSLNFSTWNAALTTTFSANSSAMTLATSTGSSTEPSTATMYFSLVGNSNQLGSFYGQVMTGINESQGTFGGRASASRTYTGFILSSSSTNITGTVSIYGLATA